MAAYSWTASNVKPASTNTAQPRVAIVKTGVTVVAGAACLLDENQQVILAANTSAALSGVNGQLFIAGSGNGEGKPVVLYPVGAEIEYGAAVFAGVTRLVYLGGAGVLEPVGDQSNGDWSTIVGVSISTTTMRVLGLALNLEVTGL